MLRETRLVVTSVDRNGHRGAYLLAGTGMEEDPLVKVTFSQYIHLVLAVQGFTGRAEQKKKYMKSRLKPLSIETAALSLCISYTHTDISCNLLL